MTDAPPPSHSPSPSGGENLPHLQAKACLPPPIFLRVRRLRIAKTPSPLRGGRVFKKQCNIFLDSRLRGNENLGWIYHLVRYILFYHSYPPLSFPRRRESIFTKFSQKDEARINFGPSKMLLQFLCLCR